LSDATRHDRLFRGEAIVLQGIDFKEADRILTVYCREHGKLSVIAKAIRKPTSRLGFGLDHLSHVRLTLAHGRTIDTVTNAELVDAHLELSGQIEAYAYASHLAELVNRLTQERQENRQIFDLLAGGIRAIADGTDPFAVSRYCELAFFAILGFRIELYRCISCGRDLQATSNALSARLGGFLCQNCLDEDRAAVPMTVNAQKYLRLLDRGGLDQIVSRAIGDELRRELEAAMIGYARFHAERDLTSLAVLRSLQSNTSAPFDQE
jgi:DNA repair protein RecO (recombination protein O)